MKVIALCAQKGGTGKTSTTAALGAGLHKAGQHVLFVDLDPQANLSAMLGADTTGKTITDVFTGKKITTAIQTTPHGDIIAADGMLAAKGTLAGSNPEYRLQQALEPVRKKYDVVLVDCAPTLGLLTVAGLTAADGAIIPLKADRFSCDSLAEILDTIQTVKRRTNRRLSVYGVLITMFSKNATVQRVMLEELTEKATAAGITVYSPPIRKGVAVEEMQITGTLSRSGAADDYRQFTAAVLKQLKGE